MSRRGMRKQVGLLQWLLAETEMAEEVERRRMIADDEELCRTTLTKARKHTLILQPPVSKERQQKLRDLQRWYQRLSTETQHVRHAISYQQR
eukprot:gene5724-2474_t